jgi:hypothetical protein
MSPFFDALFLQYAILHRLSYFFGFVLHVILHMAGCNLKKLQVEKMSFSRTRHSKKINR